MRLKNLYVVDAILPETLIGDTIEDATILEARICKKEVVGHITEYIDLSSNMRYSEEQKIGYDRIDPKSLRPLSEYYNSSEYNHSNRKEVREKVKTL